MKQQVDYVIVGAGPAGLQLACYLEKNGRDYVILERAENAGAFFDTFPRRRKLISINKVNTGNDDAETNLRWDWNSLLCDDEDLLFRKRALLAEAVFMTDDRTEALGAVLSSRYTIERELGHGGMAIVYLARDNDLGRDVALKVLRPELAASLGAGRFLREIEIAAKLSHPNVLGLLDRGIAPAFRCSALSAAAARFDCSDSVC